MEVEFGHFILSNFQLDRETERSAAAEPEAAAAKQSGEPPISEEHPATPRNWAMRGPDEPSSTPATSAPCTPTRCASHTPKDLIAVVGAAPCTPVEPAGAATEIAPQRAPEQLPAPTRPALPEVSEEQIFTLARRTCPEPSIAPSNPVPLPSSRFFANSRSRFYTSLPPASNHLVHLQSSSPSTAPAPHTMPPPITSLLLPARRPSLVPLPFSEGASSRSLPPAQQGSPALPAAAPAAAVASAPPPPPPSETVVGPPTHTLQAAEVLQQQPAPESPRAEAPESATEMVLELESREPPIVAEFQPPSTQHPPAFEEAPATPTRQSSTCSTDTPSGDVHLGDPCTPDLVEDSTDKACPGAVAIADVGPEDDEATTATLEQSRNREQTEDADKPAEEEHLKPKPQLPFIPRQPSEAGTLLLTMDTVHKKQKQVILADLEGSLMLVSTSLDRFFADEQMWRKISREVAGLSARALGSSLVVPTFTGPRQAGDLSSQSRKALARPGYFRIQVPRPYPGVQYRKSKRLDDRYPRYAEKGSVVEGMIEEDGEWLRTNGHGYLPMRLGDSVIIVPLEPESAKKQAKSHQGHSPWCLCGAPTHDEPTWPPEDISPAVTSAGRGEMQPDPYRKI
mmetsp:Transcript_79017/g.235484  ORF Transcript_79017/g.235484 Transcript_79017/m.235484 type:complete len:624 (+) Transcript_79017:69-1940(+)